MPVIYLTGWFGFGKVEEVNWDNPVDVVRLGLNDECDELFKTEVRTEGICIDQGRSGQKGCVGGFNFFPTQKETAGYK